MEANQASQPSQNEDDSLPVNTVISTTDISSVSGSKKVDELLQLLTHEEFRKKTIEIMKEYAGHTEFIGMVKSIVTGEFEDRKLKGYRSMVFTALRYIGAIGVGVIIGWITHGKAG